MNEIETRAVLLLAVLVLACGIGLVLRRRAGRAREVIGGEVLSAAELGVALGGRATLVQFSSPTCSSCRSVRQVLGELVAADPGLARAEVDAAADLDLAQRLGIMRTPTVLVLDPAGRVTQRMSGPLTAAQARAALYPHDPAPEPEQLRSR